jgi:hypothetical protein
MFVRKKPIILKYSFRTYSFYRPEKMLKFNFLVVRYILKRITPYGVIAPDPLGDSNIVSIKYERTTPPPVMVAKIETHI